MWYYAIIIIIIFLLLLYLSSKWKYIVNISGLILIKFLTINRNKLSIIKLSYENHPKKIKKKIPFYIGLFLWVIIFIFLLLLISL